jgi:Uma2 family endonuclease
MEALQSLSRIPEKYQDNSVFVKSGGSEDGLFVSEEEYWEKYYNHPDFSYEWKNGYLEEKPVADHKSYLMYKWFLKLADQFLTVHPIAEMTGLEIGFRLELPGDTSIRKPDMAIVLNDNPVILHLTDCNYSGTFDMCIESLSYSKLKEIKRDTVDKKKEYQGIGVREYYILDARKKETAFYRLNRKGKYEKIQPVGTDIIQSEVLPGFRFRISDLYEQRSLEELTEDEVYQDYVLPFYRDARQKAELERRKALQAEQRAESEKQKADQERQRAEQAEQKAARLAQKLRELGIDPEN